MSLSLTCAISRRLASLSLLCLMAASVLLSGCSMDKPGGGEAAPKKAAGTPNAGPKAAFKIAGIGMQNDQFFKIVEYGMKSYAKQNDLELSMGNSGGALDKEISLIDTYTSQKVDAIVIAPNNPKASVAALKRASDQGIKIVTYDSSIDADFPVATIKSDQVALGKATGVEAANYIKGKMGGKAKIAVIHYAALLPQPSAERTKGFEDEVKKLPGVEIVTEQDAWMADKAVGVVEGVLTAHPDVNLIWAANEGGTVGAVMAVRNAGKAGKIVVFGTDISGQIADFLLANENILQAVTGQKPFEIGWRSMAAAWKALTNDKVEKSLLLPGDLFTRSKPKNIQDYKNILLHNLPQ